MPSSANTSPPADKIPPQPPPHSDRTGVTYKPHDSVSVIVLTFLAIASYCYHNIFQASFKPAVDFQVFYEAARSFREVGSPYISGYFFYHILAAILLAPLTLLPFHVAKLTWLLINHTFVLMIFIFGVRLLPSPPDGSRPYRWLTICLGISAPLTYAFQLGSMDIFVLALIVVGTYQASRSQPIGAGALLALAIIIKPWAAFPLLGWLCGGVLVAALWASGFTALGFGLCAFIYPRATQIFLATLFAAGSKGSSYIDNYSISGFVRKATTPLNAGEPLPSEWFLTRSAAYQAVGREYWIALAISLIVLIAVSLYVYNHHRQHLHNNPEWAVWVFLTLVPIVFPVAWPSWFIVLILPLAAVLTVLQLGSFPRWMIYIASASLYLATTHDSYLIFFYVPLISPILWGMRLLGAVLLLGLVLYSMQCPITRPRLNPL